MIVRTRRVALIGIILIATACSNGAADVASESTTTTSQPTAEQSPTTTVSSADAQDEPLLVGADPVIQITPTEGGGPRPILAWEGADGASSYFVVVKDDEGAAYWAWEGSETSIPLGGAEFPQDHGNGPTIGPGYTWSVSAYAGDGTFLAISGDRPISP